MFSVDIRAEANQGVIQAIDAKFAGLVAILAKFLFLNIPFTQIPLIIFLLAFGGIFFTFRYGWISIRGFKHSIDVIRGKYDRPHHEGEITHFQALTSALSATIGLGNIAGVAVAIGMGGPGAIFWMWICAVFGMCSKFSSCMFAQLYREVDAKTGVVRGGPMYYIKLGLADLSPKLKILGKILAALFALFCIGGSFGGGNLFQSNQMYEQLRTTFPNLNNYAVLVGLILAFFVGLVIIGGIKRIGEVTSKLVPFMCSLYVLASMYIIFSHLSEIPFALVQIIKQAFYPNAMFGGFMGVLITGVRRASFSNEAGLGSAAIAHAAAKTDEPVREGIVAMIGPFIDTIVVCTMTALVVYLTGVYDLPEYKGAGVSMTSAAFESAVSWFPYFLTLAVLCFSYSTIIAWSYYGEKACEYLFGRKSVPIYKMSYVLFCALGPILKLSNVLDFTDLLILSMAFPNIIAMVILSGKGKAKLNDYWQRYKTGKMKKYK